MTNPASRPFTRLAASLIGNGASEALQQGRCPTCRGEIGPFRDQLSAKEFRISGMCQACQDSVFGKGQE